MGGPLGESWGSSHRCYSPVGPTAALPPECKNNTAAVSLLPLCLNQTAPAAHPTWKHTENGILETHLSLAVLTCYKSILRGCCEADLEEDCARQSEAGPSDARAVTAFEVCGGFRTPQQRGSQSTVRRQRRTLSQEGGFSCLRGAETFSVYWK